jgi:aspartyl-tRNA synthetase
MQNIVNIRHKAVKFIRDFLTDQGFLEIETPILIKSTPEGARDYLVPSRLYPGKFYSLPQSPQQLKQLLMSAGFEKYFQIARCFRDEDPRADRQPEFTQLDLEMSFVESDDILSLIEKLYYDLVKAITPSKNIKFPFPRIPYNEVIEKYGTDKPDLRFGIEMSTVVDWAKKTDINILKTIISNKGTVKSLSAPGCGNYTRGQISELEELVKTSGGKGLMWIAISEGAKSIEDLKDDDIKSPVSKVLKLNEIQEIASILSAAPGDLILIVAGPGKIVNQSLSLIRDHLGTSLGLKDPNSFEFAFITNFPLFEWKEEEKRWDAAHHPFTMPLKEHLGIISTDPSKVTAHCYDLVCNGLECGSGSIRIHSRKLQEEVFGVLGYSKEEVASRFDQLLTAFEYGTPPHGGIATGIERLVMLLAGTDNIRDVVAFPKTQSFIDPLFDAPDYVSNEQLNELHIKVNPTET